MTVVTVKMALTYQAGLMDSSNLIQKRMMTIDQVAELLQVPKSWVYEKTRNRYSDKNPIPCRIFGKHIRFPPEQLERWMQSQDSSLKFRDNKKSRL